MGIFSIKTDSPTDGKAPLVQRQAVAADIMGHVPQAPQANSSYVPPNNFLYRDASIVNDLLGLNLGGTILGAVSASAAQKHAIVYACTRIIAGSVAQCPLRCYEGMDGMGGDATRIDPDLEMLWNREPHRGWSAQEMVEHLVHRMLLHGNGYAIILRNMRNGGRPVGFKPLENWQVYGARQRDGSMAYLVYDDDGIPTPYDQDDILHFRGFPSYYGIGSSVLYTGAQNAVSIGLQAERRAQAAFINGILGSLVIKREGGWNEKSKKEFRKKFEATYGKGVDSADAPIVIDQKTEIENLGMSAEAAQLLESREFQVTEIARAFGLPSYLVNQEAKNTSFGSGVSRIAEAFLRFTLTPIIKRFEQEITRKCYIMMPTKYAQLDTTGLTRATAIERFGMWRNALGGNGQSGHMSVNDIRESENKPKLTRMLKIGNEEVNVFDQVYTGFDQPGGITSESEGETGDDEGSGDEKNELFGDEMDAMVD